MINEFRPMNHLSPLQNFICTIGNLPTSYALSLSYEEQVWWLCNFIEKTVLPAIENNTEITEETQQAFLELQNYVKDYFNNLDVQDEINNKLDEMAESGVLEQLIGDYVMKKLDYYLIDNTITTEELQALLNINRAKVIEFQNGTYNFTNTLRLNKNTKLICNNAIINNTNRHMFYNFKDTDTNITGYNGQSNIEIIGGRFNAGFSFIHGKNIIFKNIHFYHIENDHCIEICACNNVVVDGCKFEGVKTQENSRNYVENVQIENANYTNFPWLTENSSTYDETPCDTVEVKNCKFIQPNIITYRFYSAIGGHTYTENKPHDNIIIHDNEVTDSLNSAIRLHNIINAKIYNNNFKQNNQYTIDNTDVTAIRLYNGVQNIDIYNNLIDGYSQHLYIAEGGINVRVNNNTFKNIPLRRYDDTSECFWLTYRGVKNLTITNNDFINILGAILQSLSDSNKQGTKTIFSDNTITAIDREYETNEIFYYRCRFYGVETVVVNNNIINENVEASYFVSLHHNVSRCFMSNNKMYKGSSRLLYVNDYTGSLSNIYGIPFVGYTGNTQITENTNFNYNYKEFNKMVVVWGSGVSTIIKTLYAFDAIRNKLDARTWNFTVYTSGSSTPEKATLTFNDDGTFVFSCTNNAYSLRNIIFINE